MPIYLFRCQECSVKFEKTMSIKSEEPAPCPLCKKPADKLPPQNVSANVAEPTSIPKDIDRAVGADAEKKWLEYEDRKSMKEKIRQEYGTQRLSRDPDGNYVPLTLTKDGAVVSEDEAVGLRKEMFKEYMTVKNDPETKKLNNVEE